MLLSIKLKLIESINRGNEVSDALDVNKSIRIGKLPNYGMSFKSYTIQSVSQ